MMAADHHFDGRSLVWDLGRASLPKVGKDRDPSLPAPSLTSGAAEGNGGLTTTRNDRRGHHKAQRRVARDERSPATR